MKVCVYVNYGCSLRTITPNIVILMFKSSKTVILISLEVGALKV